METSLSHDAPRDITGKRNLGGSSQKGVRRVERIGLVCAECGTHYERLACQIKPSAKNYCSKACVGKSKRHGSTLFCALCDSPFYRAIAEQDIGEKVNQFCSKACYHDYREINTKDSTYKKIGTMHAHRFVAESVLGRSLLDGEVVHHIDLDKHNNDPLNLCVFPNQSTHARCHFGDMSDQELSKYYLVTRDSMEAA